MEARRDIFAGPQSLPNESPHERKIDWFCLVVAQRDWDLAKAPGLCETLRRFERGQGENCC